MKLRFFTVFSAVCFVTILEGSILPSRSTGTESTLRFFDKHGNMIILKSKYSSMTEKNCIFKNLLLEFSDSVCNADQGTFDIVNSIGKLSNNITYKNPKFVLNTDKLKLDFNKKKISTKSNTRIDFNKKALLSADEFEYDIKKSKMRLTKNVKLKIMNLQNSRNML